MQSLNRSRYRSRSCFNGATSARSEICRASQPGPISFGADLRNVVVPSSVNDEKIALLSCAGVHGASHPVRNDEIAIAVDDGDRHRQRFDPRDCVEVHPGNEFPERIDPWNEHPPGHVLSGSEWGLQDEGTGPRSHRELSRDRTTEGMTKKNEPVRCHAEAVARVLQRGQRVTSRRRIGRNASEAIVSAVLRQHNTQVRALDDVLSPGNEPARDVGVSMKREHDRLLGGTVADDVREEPQAVRGCVVDSTGVDRARRRSGGRLENDALLKTPEQEQESEISEPKAD